MANPFALLQQALAMQQQQQLMAVLLAASQNPAQAANVNEALGAYGFAQTPFYPGGNQAYDDREYVQHPSSKKGWLKPGSAGGTFHRNIQNSNEECPPGLVADKRIFVGGLAPHMREETLRNYFGQFGDIAESKVVIDPDTGNSKNYGFVTFATFEASNAAVVEQFHFIEGRRCNVNLQSVPKPVHQSDKEPLKRPREELHSSEDAPEAKKRRAGEPAASKQDRQSTFVEQLAEQGFTVSIEDARQKIQELAAENAPEAFKYFLEVGDLFRGQPEFDTYYNDLLDSARRVRIAEARSEGRLSGIVQSHGYLEGTAASASSHTHETENEGEINEAGPQGTLESSPQPDTGADESAANESGNNNPLQWNPD